MGKKIRAPKGDVRVKVDPKLKKEYDALVAVISDSSRKEAEDFDRRWEAAAKVVEHELYVIGGYEDADPFFRAVMQEEPRNARRFMRVAKYASPSEETTYGTSKLDAALGFVEAKLGHPLAHPPLPVAFDKLRIPVGKGTKGLETASVPEITAATSKLTASWHKKPKTPAQSALAEQIAKIDSLGGVRVHERDGILSFTGVPLGAIHHFIRALTAAKLPKASAGKKKPR
ncbi:MAG TPA: hypothetical protein VGH28_28865 [Polyangiaceae bacterium]|jgi:hypothetical protein